VDNLRPQKLKPLNSYKRLAAISRRKLLAQRKQHLTKNLLIFKTRRLLGYSVGFHARQLRTAD
jgi:hypothetical protein